MVALLGLVVATPAKPGIFMNYAAIKGSVLRRCRLVMSLMILRSTANIMSRSWPVSARDGNGSRVISRVLMNSFWPSGYYQTVCETKKSFLKQPFIARAIFRANRRHYFYDNLKCSPFARHFLFDYICISVHLSGPNVRENE